MVAGIMCGMATTLGDTDRHLQKLAAIVRRRRVALGFASKEAAADHCGISHTTYRKIEGTRNAGPLPVEATTYDKVDHGFGFATNSCKRVADGLADSIKLLDGTELIEGGTIRDFANLKDDIEWAYDKSAQLTNPDQTHAQAKAHKEAMFRFLAERGVTKTD